jgi:hypothetical protein
MPQTLHVAHDHDGNIIVMSESEHHPMPVHAKNLTRSKFEVPTKFAGKKLREYAHLLTIDVSGHTLKEK